MLEDDNGITVSVVIHENELMLKDLLNRLINDDLIKKIIITNNNKLNINFPNSKKITLINNKKIKSYSDNNNAAFQLCKTLNYLVINPDIDLKNLNLRRLYNLLNNDNNCALITPNIYSNNKKNHFKKNYNISDLIIKNKNEEIIGKCIKEVRYVSGCFMLFKSEIFRCIDGFDSRYRLYLEDYDICNKIHIIGKTILVDGESVIFHQARKTSKKNLKYFFIHLNSLIKYFSKWGNKFD